MAGVGGTALYGPGSPRVDTPRGGGVPCNGDFGVMPQELVHSLLSGRRLRKPKFEQHVLKLVMC
jgi:hypothetical protein